MEQQESSVEIYHEGGGRNKGIFSGNDHDDKSPHLKNGDDENNGSKEKSGFMEKEAEFVKNLKNV